MLQLFTYAANVVDMSSHGPCKNVQWQLQDKSADRLRRTPTPQVSPAHGGQAWSFRGVTLAVKGLDGGVALLLLGKARPFDGSMQAQEKQKNVTRSAEMAETGCT